MKRLLTFLVIILLPMSAMAMTPLADTTLAGVTGQAGVSINADLRMNIDIGTMSWGDSDGVSGVYSPWTEITGGGYVGVTNFNISNLRIKARDDVGDNFDGYLYTQLKPITIDVATDTAATPLYGGATFVRIGLGSLQITMDDMSMGVMLDDYTTAGDISAGQMMGTINVGGMAMYIDPSSYVDIYAHSGCGVNFTFDVEVDRLGVEYLSWGDTDGLTSNPSNLGAAAPWFTYGGAGFVGLNDIQIGDATSPAVRLNGTVAIDVTTASQGLYPYFYSMLTMLETVNSPVLDIRNPTQMRAFMQFVIDNGYDPLDGTEVAICAHFYILLNGGGNVPVNFVTYPLTIVHISAPTDVNLQVARMTADVCLDSTPDFTSADRGTLGDIYLQGLNLTVQAGSWVDIWAH